MEKIISCSQTYVHTEKIAYIINFIKKKKKYDLNLLKKRTELVAVFFSILWPIKK